MIEVSTLSVGFFAFENPDFEVKILHNHVTSHFVTCSFYLLDTGMVLKFCITF